ncbi:hypothetical protein [Nonomuraea monospora]|uniref:hypothetical protein n=1 Tax=Nonomuraea monospora TaxID=568818 RepID=UPI0031D2BEC8
MAAIVVRTPPAGRRAAGESCRYDTGCSSGGPTTTGVVPASAPAPATTARIGVFAYEPGLAGPRTGR